MATNTNSNPNDITKPVMLHEIGPDGIARESPVIAYTEKIIEEEQFQLRKYIDENYSKIRDVEKEFANLSMEMKLTAGPKKAALELMRKKIEMSTERIRVAKLKEEQARKAWEAASQAVKDEEAIKQKLCEDLNSLVLESSNSQLARLEELKRRLEALNPSRASIASASDQNTVVPTQSSMAQDVSSVKDTQESLSGSSGNTLKEGNARSSAAENGRKQLPSLDEARGKKKINLQGRGKGIGIVPKGRGSAAPGWTGAGFDVDGRS
ncbi:uncharacterized protein LOC132065622 isoform X1 [Lycium ferocissimum]|uniref:uncharacterized protein LOC132065622 isoform X1 n=1 Tax=Lycium ferocissimum TaxID=112874 RepID=UPI0028159409|nr:uncharacterized protein LOC132065622 isoform X1 [Lycium ferocissimum]